MLNAGITSGQALPTLQSKAILLRSPLTQAADADMHDLHNGLDNNIISVPCPLGFSYSVLLLTPALVSVICLNLTLVSGPNLIFTPGLTLIFALGPRLTLGQETDANLNDLAPLLIPVLF